MRHAVVPSYPRWCYPQSRLPRQVQSEAEAAVSKRYDIVFRDKCVTPPNRTTRIFPRTNALRVAFSFFGAHECKRILASSHSPERLKSLLLMSFALTAHGAPNSYCNTVSTCINRPRAKDSDARIKQAAAALRMRHLF